MHSNRISFLAAVLLLEAGALAQPARPYYYDSVAIGGSQNGLTFNSPVINNNGTVAFYTTKYLTGSGILKGPSFENDAIFTETGVGPYSSIATSFALNDLGQVAVKATVRATNQSGIFVHDDTTHDLMAGWGTIGSSPLGLTNNGKVAIGATYGLYTYNPRRNHDIFLLGQAGVSSSARVAENTFTGPPGTFRTLESGSYVVNEAGQNAFMAQAWDQQPNGYIEGVYQNNSTSSAVWDTTGRFFDTDGWLDINNSGTLAFTASTDDNLFVDALFRGRGEDSVRIAATGPEYLSIKLVDINDAGSVAFNAQLTGTPGQGVFTGASKIDDKVVAPGDVLFGRTVRDAYFRRGGLNNQGQVAFYYIATDLQSGIAVATPAMFGDADLNRVINFDDYARIDSGFNNGSTGWANGDFDGNGVINFDDYSLIDAEFNRQNNSGAGTRAVPEPVTALSTVALLFAGRRRR